MRVATHYVVKKQELLSTKKNVHCRQFHGAMETTYQNLYKEKIGMADWHNDVTYKGWGKNPAESHRKCMGNSQLVFVTKVGQIAKWKDQSSPYASK